MEASVSSCTAPSLPSLFLRRKVLWTTRTGFIITDDGDIITNAQVVQGGCRVQVELKSGDRFDATIRRVDEEVNIALIHINSSMKLPILRLCTSTAVRSGQTFIAVGNPPAFKYTVTLGIVSHRRLYGDYDIIVHSAFTTEEFSGGPLINLIIIPPTSQGSSFLLFRSRNIIPDIVDATTPAVVSILCFWKSLFFRREAWLTRTGFIVTDDGDIITNAHIVWESCRVQVELRSGDRFDATIKPMDEADIALIHINSSGGFSGEPLINLGNGFVSTALIDCQPPPQCWNRNVTDIVDVIMPAVVFIPLPIFHFGSSAAVRLGETVLAFGNPPPYIWTRTMWMVSGRRLHGSISVIVHSAFTTISILKEEGALDNKDWVHHNR
ncbi:uncharacterized protein LOC111946378 isoform X3 [Oryzias latipes]|uniref:uncharacterized protein LOC111946378 isoform X2 n=1 Tax=Oryzias latipes TaxID=8090 RepID=UPI000CE21B04|nr:uncharacterized protein LOC111946378 isoform X2 [Oryzias latipes]XP_023804984.1 uncharacterized protein LOC111946378 isoform X3 [Oryzias latipes]